MSDINESFLEIKNSYYLTLAFKVRNSFDDMILENEGLVVYLDDKLISPLRKDKGYYVLMNIPKKQFKLKITSHNYFDKIVSVDIDKIKREDKCIDIYLIPNFKYVSEPSEFYIDGEADSSTEVFGVKLSNRTNIRFMSYDKKLSLLKVSNPAQENITGHLMAVIDGEKNNFQEFFIKDRISLAEYEIDKDINKTYKISSPIQKAYVTQSDNEGRYRLYINNYGIKDENYVICFYKNKKKTFKVIDFNKEKIKE